MALLEISHLRKTFGAVVAVEDISFSVEKGEIFTIIGPNGAGKTTTLEMVAMGKTTILTTHYMEEADKLSDRVCIVDQGKVVAIDTPKNLIAQLSQEREVQLTFSEASIAERTLKEVIAENPATSKARVELNHLFFTTFRPEESLYHLFKYTMENKVAVEQVRLQDMSLEDVFIAFTGKEWRD